jgi:hypothetical protein
VARFNLLNDTDVSLQLKRFRVVLTDDAYSLFSTLRPAWVLLRELAVR